MIKTVDDKRYQRIEELFLKARARIIEAYAAVNAIVDQLEGVLEVVEEDEENMAGDTTVTQWIDEAVWNNETTDELLKYLYIKVSEEEE